MTQARSMEGPLAVLVVCPLCGAGFMEHCSTPTGWSATTHSKRWKAAGLKVRPYSVDGLDAGSRDYVWHLLRRTVHRHGPGRWPGPSGPYLPRMLWWRDAVLATPHPLPRDRLGPGWDDDRDALLARLQREFREDWPAVEARALALVPPAPPPEPPQPHTIGDTAARANRAQWRVLKGDGL